jgi:hypothetical protein
MCYQAESALTDGTAVFGNVVSLQHDLPICRRRKRPCGWCLSTVIADESGEFEAEFSAFLQAFRHCDFVSIYEGDCVMKTCVEGCL